MSQNMSSAAVVIGALRVSWFCHKLAQFYRSGENACKGLPSWLKISCNFIRTNDKWCQPKTNFYTRRKFTLESMSNLFFNACATKRYVHWCISHYAFTHVRNKNNSIQVMSPNVVKVIFHTIRNCSKRKERSRSIWEQILSFKINSHLKKNTIEEIHCLIQKSPFDVRNWSAFWLHDWP